jgi:hypothetical protein
MVLAGKGHSSVVNKLTLHWKNVPYFCISLYPGAAATVQVFSVGVFV